MEPVVLICAGLDPSGGAGLLADVATCAVRGVRAAGVVTALTEQDSARTYRVVPVDAALVAAQLARIVADLPIAAVQIGMVGDAKVAQAIASALAQVAAPLVLDPVLRASSGASLFDGDPDALAPLLARAALVTPNRDEAARISRLAVDDRDGQRAAAAHLRGLGAGAALVKGGHLPGDEVVDLFQDGAGELTLSSPRVPGDPPHGTGCALAAEIACALALGAPLRAAVTTAHARLADRIVRARKVGRGRKLLPI